MRGLPDFNTREDVENSLELYPYSARVKLKNLYEDRYTWVKTGDLMLPADGIVDDTHIVSEEQDGGYVQLEKVVDRNAAIYRLGFSDSEIEEILKNIDNYSDNSYNSEVLNV